MIKKITTLDDHVRNVLSDEQLNLFRRENTWPASELCLASIFLSILGFFVSTPHISRRISSFTLKEVPESDIRLGAVNFRGLYQRDGRQTSLVPCGNFSPGVADHRKERHKILHAIYLYLVHRAASINQLFLATTNFDSLSVKFQLQTTPDSTVSKTGNHATVNISSRLALDLAPEEIRQEWSSVIDFVLSGPWNEVRAILRDIKRYILPPRFSGLRDKVSEHLRRKGRDLVFSNLSLLNQWRQVFRPCSDESPKETLARFEEWLRSLCLLQFYCRAEHAGRYFYTARLPELPNTLGSFPDSSLSIVAARELPPAFSDTFIGLKRTLSEDPAFTKLLNSARECFERFVSDRKALLKTEGVKFQFATILEECSGPLPLDFARVDFLIKMARKLVGQMHEGHDLRYCFVFGFSRRRIDAESQGLIEDVCTGLNVQWENFATCFNVGQNPEAVATAMSKWIKTNDLQLQPWEVALFFEETAGDAWPVPTSIIRLHHASTGVQGVVGTEIQLRHVLRHITTGSTTGSKTTLGVLVSKGSLTLFIAGKSFIIPCNATDEWWKPVLPLVKGTKPVEDIINLFLADNLRSIFDGMVDTRIIKCACSLITKLCEALVSLRHGALILIGMKNQGSDHLLPPLNPVWSLRDEVSHTAIESDCTIYALMSALDGATEIVLPRKGSSESILFGCRRAVLTRTPIWHERHDGQLTLAKGINVEPLSLVGKGMRHHSALALSKEWKSRGLVITVSADGPVTLWRDGRMLEPPDNVELRYA